MKQSFLFSTLLFITCFMAAAQTKPVSTVHWSDSKLTLPESIKGTPNPGVAMPFSGIHDGHLFVGGGANFPNVPVADGGKKVYHRDLFIYDLKNQSWLPKEELPFNVAYGQSIPHSSGIICLGGLNSDGELNKVFRMTFNRKKNKAEFEFLPELPVTAHSFAATLFKEKIYVIGGSLNGTPANDVFVLDLNDLKNGWQKKSPYPGKARLQSIAIAQNSDHKKNKIYLFSGHRFSQHETHISTTFLSYDPAQDKWSDEKEIVAEKGGAPLSLGGACGIAVGDQHIIFTGGYNKEIFEAAIERERFIKNISDDAEKDKLNKEAVEYLKKPLDFFQWNNRLLAFHTVTETWHTIDQVPFRPTCGSVLLHNEEKFYLVNGEIKPGIRTPDIHVFTLDKESHFHKIDYTILALYLVGMLGLGFFFMRRENGTEDFFKGGGRIPWWASGISIFATMLSSISFMAIPAMTYISDWRYFTMAVTIFLMAPVIIYYYLPFFRKLNVTSAYEYLEKRFNIQTRILGSLSFIIFMIARIAIVLYLPALALSTVTGISVLNCILIIGIITIIYCATGGIEAVVWGDVIQGGILVIGALIAIFYLIAGTDGGMSGVFDIAQDRQKMAILDMTFDLSKPVFWVVLLGGLANNLTSYSSDQSVIQRYVTTDNSKNAARSIWLNGILSIPISLILYYIGTALYTYYQSNPQMMDVTMPKNDSIFPTFIVNSLPVGISGVLIAAIFSATMSTLSSNINSAATAFTTDFFTRFKKEVSDHQALKVAKISTVIIGLTGIVFSIMLAEMNIKTVFDHFMKIVGIITSGLGGLFLMGIFFKRISGQAALIGLAISYLVLFAVNFGWVDIKLHLLTYGLIGLVSCVIAGLAASFILPNKKDLSGLCLGSLNDEICK